MRVPAAKRTAKRRSPYSVHPGVAMMQDWVATLKPKTGRRLEEWVALVKRGGPPEEAARREWLKREHGLGTNAAWWIAERAEGKGGEDADPKAYLAAARRWVEAMFADGKAGLRPAYDALLDLALSLGKDVKACPGKTIVPLYRKHVFAQLKASTRTRLDLGLALAKAKRVPKRLLETGGLEKGDRITHRIPIQMPGDIDDEVRLWLRTAYELDG
jgi:uncharacterized protein DUF5655/uncharacterized protein DUF4287